MDIELSRGFVAFPRGLTDWEWYTEPNTARLYFHLLLTANWSRKQWQGITIQPGQLVTSQPHLAAQLNLSTMQVRSADNRLHNRQNRAKIQPDHVRKLQFDHRAQQAG